MNFSSLFQFLVCHKHLKECIMCNVNTKSLRVTGLDTDNFAKLCDVTKTPTTDVRGSTVLWNISTFLPNYTVSHPHFKFYHPVRPYAGP
jgi:hypothetical protein